MAKFCKICDKLNPNQLLKVCSYACDSKYQEQNPKKPEPFKPIRKRSLKRAKQEMVYTLKRKKYLEENEFCERCLQIATEIHHKAKRHGDLLTNEDYFMAVCRTCHNYIENHYEESILMGWRIKLK